MAYKSSSFVFVFDVLVINKIEFSSSIAREFELFIHCLWILPTRRYPLGFIDARVRPNWCHSLLRLRQVVSELRLFSRMTRDDDRLLCFSTWMGTIEEQIGAIKSILDSMV